MAEKVEITRELRELFQAGWVDENDEFLIEDGAITIVNSQSVTSQWKDMVRDSLMKERKEFEIKRGLTHQDWSNEPGPDVNPNEVYVLYDMKQTCEYLNISNSTLHRLRTSEPDFPEPIALGKKKLRWKSSDLDNWMNRGR